MMLRRFKLFAVGVLLGSVVLIYIFQQRQAMSWFPKDKIRVNLKKNALSFSEKSSCQLQALGINEAELKESFGKASIDFSKSEVERKPCPIYQLQLEITGKGKMNAFCEMCDSVNALVSIVDPTKKDTCGK